MVGSRSSTWTLNCTVSLLIVSCYWQQLNCRMKLSARPNEDSIDWQSPQVSSPYNVMKIASQVFYLRLLRPSFLPLQYAGLICFHSTGLFSEILTGLITVKKAQKLCKMMPQSDPTTDLLVTSAVSVTTGSKNTF